MFIIAFCFIIIGCFWQIHIDDNIFKYLSCYSFSVKYFTILSIWDSSTLASISALLDYISVKTVSGVSNIISGLADLSSYLSFFASSIDNNCGLMWLKNRFIHCETYCWFLILSWTINLINLYILFKHLNNTFCMLRSNLLNDCTEY